MTASTNSGMDGENDDELLTGPDMFREPEGFYDADKEPTFAEHALLSGEKLRIRLVGFNPLWGHHLWNAGRILATYLEQNADALIRGRSVLELGAAAGLPSLVAAKSGAANVVMTDYPDSDLIENMKLNVKALPEAASSGNIVAQGYLWGDPVLPLLVNLLDAEPAGFDTLVLGDLLFNHSEHAKLLKTVQGTLKKSPPSVALVFFTPYRPWLLEKDLAFFDLAKKAGFEVHKILEKVVDKVMFIEDPGVGFRTFRSLCFADFWKG